MDCLRYLAVLFSVAVPLGTSAFGGQSQGQPAQTKPEALKLVEAPGRDVVVNFCSDCHEAESRILKAKRSDEGWTQVVSDMQGMGSKNTGDDTTTIVTYLAKNYGCAPPKKSGDCDPNDKPLPSH